MKKNEEKFYYCSNGYGADFPEIGTIVRGPYLNDEDTEPSTWKITWVGGSQLMLSGVPSCCSVYAVPSKKKPIPYARLHWA